MDLNKSFSEFATKTAAVTGSPWTFGVCLATVIAWAVSGPFFKFSETWQLVINTGTTIVTFLMVFLIQNSQNRDGLAIQTKLDELILSSAAENGFIGIEKLSDKELREMQARCSKAAQSHGKLAEHAERELTKRKTSVRSAVKAKAASRPARSAHA